MHRKVHEKEKNMSTLENERSLSKKQYIETARNLLRFTTDRCLRLPKRLTFVITTELIKTAQEIYKYVLEIRSIYSKDDYLQRRVDLCQIVIARLDYLASNLDILQVYCPMGEPTDNKKKRKQLTPYTFEKWTALIEEESLLIKGLISSEKSKKK